MITSRRGLEVLVALAVIGGVLLVLDLRRDAATTDRSLARGLDVEKVTALGWTRPDGDEIQLVREGERWLWIKPVEATANRSVINNILATLRAAHWHRRKPAEEAGETPVTLTISTAMPTAGGKPPEYVDLPRRTLRIGELFADSELAWIVDGDDALLVDAWVVRTLVPTPAMLMVQRPLDAVGQAASIEISDAKGALRLEGTPRRLVTPYVALVKPPLVTRLHEALAELEVVALAASSKPPVPGAGELLRIVTPAGTVTIADDCSAGYVRLAATVVTGCVARTAYDAVIAALEPLRASGRDVIDPRPAPLDAATITLRDGSILDVTRQRIGDHAADPVRVTELLSVLSAPATLAELRDPLRTAKPRATLAITDRHGAAIALELLPGGIVRRPGEDLGMLVAPPAAAVLERGALAFRDLTPWVEDPLAVRGIRIDDRWSSVRGQVVGEWSPPTRASQMPLAAPDVSSALEALAIQLAAPRPISVGPAAFATAHRVVIVIAPPAGKVTEHALEVGRKTAAGCPVRAAGTSLLLPASVCDAIAAIAR